MQLLCVSYAHCPICIVWVSDLAGVVYFFDCRELQFGSYIN